MRVYFLAEETCALTVNGAYLGIVDGFERACEIAPADGVFCELKPCGCQPVTFILNEAFLLSPPEQIKLYYVREGVAVFAGNFLRADQSLQVIRQDRFGGNLLTLCMQGRLQLNLENASGFHIVPLPAAFADAKPVQYGNGFLLECDTAFAHISESGEVLVLSEGTITERGETLRAEVPFHDSVGHTALCGWQDGKLTECTIRSAREPASDTFALAFFESVLIGADPSPYLGENLSEKAALLKDYLGNYLSVVLTQQRDTVGLVYERKARVFDVRYYRVELTEGKISNIKAL